MGVESLGASTRPPWWGMEAPPPVRRGGASTRADDPPTQTRFRVESPRYLRAKRGKCDACRATVIALC